MLAGNGCKILIHITSKLISHNATRPCINLIGHIYPRARQYKFQTLGEIHTYQESACMTSVMHEFSSPVKPGIEFELDGIIEHRKHAMRRRIADADEQENGDAREKEKEEEDFRDRDRAPVEEALTLPFLPGKESDKPREGKLHGDLLDEATEVAEQQIGREFSIGGGLVQVVPVPKSMDTLKMLLCTDNREGLEWRSA
jgi:hypothetical protein